MTAEIDYGPLQSLIGVWKGNKGMDVAPDKEDGEEQNPYSETITFTPIGDVTNAGEQTLAAVRYHQTVQRLSDGETFHDEVGFWMWDAASNTVMHSLMIPRGVCLLAGGQFEGAQDGVTEINVAANVDDPNWGIVQSPFMNEKARTTAFTHQIKVEGDSMTYSETTVVDIYGKVFDHTDANELTRQS